MDVIEFNPIFPPSNQPARPISKWARIRQKLSLKFIFARSRNESSIKFALSQRLPKVFVLDARSAKVYQSYLRRSNLTPQQDTQIMESMSAFADSIEENVRRAHEHSTLRGVSSFTHSLFGVLRHLRKAPENISNNPANLTTIKIFDCGSNVARYFQRSSSATLDIARYPSDHGNVPKSLETVFREVMDVYNFVYGPENARNNENAAVIICGNNAHLELLISFLRLLSVSGEDLLVSSMTPYDLLQLHEHEGNWSWTGKPKLVFVENDSGAQATTINGVSNLKSRQKMNYSVSEHRKTEVALPLLKMMVTSPKTEFNAVFTLSKIFVVCDYLS